MRKYEIGVQFRPDHAEVEHDVSIGIGVEADSEDDALIKARDIVSDGLIYNLYV